MSRILLILTLFVGLAICGPLDTVYDDQSGNSDDGSYQPDEKIYEQQQDDSYSSYGQGSGTYESILVKREATTEGDVSTTTTTTTLKPTNQSTFSLADIINRVENSIVQSALSIASIFRIPTNRTSSEENTEDESSATTVHSSVSVSKRSTFDVDDSTVLLVESTTSENVPATNDQPAHLTIDRVSVYRAENGYFPLLPVFQPPQALTEFKFASSEDSSGRAKIPLGTDDTSDQMN